MTNEELESTPIGFLTTKQILTHMEGRTKMFRFLFLSLEREKDDTISFYYDYSFNSFEELMRFLKKAVKLITKDHKNNEF